MRWSDGGQSHTGIKKAIFIQKQEKRTEKKKKKKTEGLHGKEKLRGESGP